MGINFIGGQYFNSGCKFIGILVWVYFLNFANWKVEKEYIFPLILTVLAGLVQGYSIINSAIYSQNLPIQHSYYVAIFFVSTVATEILMIFLPIGIYLKIYGITSATIAIYFISFSYTVILEWLTIILCFSFYLLVSFKIKASRIEFQKSEQKESFKILWKN